ncbi:MAG: hypothetical protein HRU09_13615 [Oligoflexales bacterium]|nr:hypothetical protein [Oligoflexales bacterium]
MQFGRKSFLVFSFTGLFSLLSVSCNENNDFEDSEPNHSAADLIVQRKPNIPATPTNPEGGKIVGKPNSVVPADNDDRVSQNISKEIVFGKQVANISMETTLVQSQKILSKPVSAFNGQVSYDEAITVVWRETPPRVPSFISISEGYKGSLKMPPPYNEFKVGTSLAGLLGNTEEDDQNFLRTLARHFDGQDETYDCIILNSCDVIVNLTFKQYVFRQGGFIISNDVHKTINSIFFWPEIPLPTEPLTTGGIFGETIAGMNMTTVREEAEKTIGPSLGLLNDGRSVYDNGNLTILWNFFPPLTPIFLSIGDGFQGPIKLPDPYGEVKLGQSFAQYFPETDPSRDIFFQDIAKRMDGLTDLENYDCNRIRSCTYRSSSAGIDFVFDRGKLMFTNDAEKKLIAIDYYQAPEPRTVPRTEALVFGTSIGDIGLSTTQEAAHAILGEPRGIVSGNIYFYDNENLAIIWNDEDPSLPDVIQLNYGYEGAIPMPEAYGAVKMGQSFADSFPETDEFGEAFIKELGAFYRSEENPESYDCLSEETCKLISDDAAFIIFQFESGSIFFTNDEDKELYIIDIRSENLTKPVR